MIVCYLKPTNYCNVGCSHCYIPADVRANRHLMSPETLAATAAMLADMVAAGRHDGVRVLFHGGEPLTVPASWWEAAFPVLDAALPGHSEGMQTSLIPLRPDHLPMIKARFNGGVGSSIDFSQRRIGDSVEAYHRLWLSKVEMARAEGIFVVPNIVPTVRELGREAELLSWFVERGFPAFNVGRYLTYGCGPNPADRPSNRQHAGFLTSLFEAILAEMEARGRAPYNNTVYASITGVAFGIGGDKWGDHCMSNFVVVGPDGGTNNCNNKAEVDAPFSNVAEGCSAFLASEGRRHWVRHQRIGHKQSYCAGCENQSWCGSGCPITPNGAAEGEDECSGYRSYLSHVRTRIANPAVRAVALAYLDQARVPELSRRAMPAMPLAQQGDMAAQSALAGRGLRTMGVREMGAIFGATSLGGGCDRPSPASPVLQGGVRAWR